MNWSQLRKLIIQHFDIEELQDLCFDLDIDYDSLRGEGKAGKVRSLLDRCRKEGRSDDVLEFCQESRPKIDWASLTPSPSTSAVPEDDPIRNAVWNALHRTLWSQRTFISSYKEKPPKIDAFSYEMWDKHFNKPVDSRPQEPQQILQEIRTHFFTCGDDEWYKFVEFILYHWNYYVHYSADRINGMVNKAFRNQGSDLRYVPEYEGPAFVGGSIKPNPDDIYPTRPQGV